MGAVRAPFARRDTDVSMLSGLSAWLRKHLPQRTKVWFWFVTDSTWRRRYVAQQRLIRDRKRARRRAIGLISTQTAGIVASGPFKGMRYVPSWNGTDFTQKLLGTYELELNNVIEEVCNGRYRNVVDIGAGEGYYACGLTWRMPGIHMKAFEMSHEWHAAIGQIAIENGVADRLTILGACTVDALRRELGSEGGCLVVCDVDGAEFELMDPAALPGLRHADLLVEVHDGIIPGVSQTLIDRFEETHIVEFINQVPRRPADVPAGIGLDGELALKAMDEGRGEGNDWLWMRHRTN